MGNVIYSFMVFEKKSMESMMICSSYDRDWILAEAQRIADAFDVDVLVDIRLLGDEKPSAKMCIYPRKAGMK